MKVLSIILMTIAMCGCGTRVVVVPDNNEDGSPYIIHVFKSYKFKTVHHWIHLDQGYYPPGSNTGSWLTASHIIGCRGGRIPLPREVNLEELHGFVLLDSMNNTVNIEIYTEDENGTASVFFMNGEYSY